MIRREHLFLVETAADMPADEQRCACGEMTWYEPLPAGEARIVVNPAFAGGRDCMVWVGIDCHPIVPTEVA